MIDRVLNTSLIHTVYWKNLMKKQIFPIIKNMKLQCEGIHVSGFSMNHIVHAWWIVQVCYNTHVRYSAHILPQNYKCFIWRYRWNWKKNQFRLQTFLTRNWNLTIVSIKIEAVSWRYSKNNRVESVVKLPRQHTW